MRLTTVTPIPLVCTVAILAAACTGSSTRFSPTAPSPISAITAAAGGTSTDPASAGDVIDRTGSDQVVRDPHVIAQWAKENWGFEEAADLQVEGSGPVGSVSGACPDLTMYIYGIPVLVSPSTSYPIGSACSGLAAGRVVRVRGVLFVSGGTMQVLATYVTIDGGVNRPVEGEGVLTGFWGSCPSRVLVVRGVNVTLGGGTVIRWRNGVTAACEDLLVGMFLQIAAEITPEGAIIAMRITIQSGGAEPTTVSGTVSGKNGGCPSLTLVVGSSPVTTSSSTLFVDGSCSDVANGAKVEATGPRHSHGSIAATRLRILQRARPEYETVEGRVSNRSGACPSISFSAGGRTVKASSSTSYSGGTCADVQNGATVEATGSRDSSGRLVASKVRLIDNGEHVEGSGLVGTVSGSCPALTFSAFGQTVKTNSDTEFRIGSCRDVRTGAKVTVRGIRQSGYVLARVLDVTAPVTTTRR